MAKILQNRNGETSKYTVAGMTSTEFFTLFEIVETAWRKAADPDNKEYDEKTARRVIDLHNMIEQEFRNKIDI